MQPDVLYAPYRVQTGGSPIHLLFRDGRLSNAIGFEYQNSSADEAAKDLVDRLKAIGQRQTDNPFLVVIALDGENCWDFYEANGNPFLHSLYARISGEPELKSVTVSEFLSEFPADRSLSRVHPGSWINASFDTWVGDLEHNAASPSGAVAALSEGAYTVTVSDANGCLRKVTVVIGRSPCAP